MNKKKSFIKIVAIVIILGIVYTLNNQGLFGVSLDVDRIQKFVQDAGVWGVLVYILINTIRPFLFIPTAALFITGGIIFGAVQGSIYNLIGLICACSLAYFVARKFEGPFRKLVGEKYVSKLYGVEGRKAVKALFIMRVTPGFPIDPISFGAGLVNMNYRKFFLGTLLGIAPKAIIYTFLGDQIDNLYSVQTMVALGILVLLATTSYFVDV
ncbi:SNARE associated Golgi protein [Alkaliphilus metalliredigens QYMF]|uniref:TVP38/TMEM64 family membrane protein n=1 Tax=Alkaliphilus metalliredigens (strain QYMF) TaxID=293826 RepID=A6TJC3_ALKMQ|nr:TVP38/TMEM64 family protein [Alkaliphilus metalliredigens]ABR46291.1 SNARE associated Golgi protein [Alkaliphilus metalliredigens QYMF]